MGWWCEECFMSFGLLPENWLQFYEGLLLLTYVQGLEYIFEGSRRFQYTVRTLWTLDRGWNGIAHTLSLSIYDTYML